MGLGVKEPVRVTRSLTLPVINWNTMFYGVYNLLAFFDTSARSICILSIL